VLGPHGTVAFTVKVVLAPGARDRSRNSAEPDVKLVVPEAPGATEAPVIMKPAGAEICTEPRC